MEMYGNDKKIIIGLCGLPARGKVYSLFSIKSSIKDLYLKKTHKISQLAWI